MPLLEGTSYYSGGGGDQPNGQSDPRGTLALLQRARAGQMQRGNPLMQALGQSPGQAASAMGSQALGSMPLGGAPMMAGAGNPGGLPGQAMGAQMGGMGPSPMEAQRMSALENLPRNLEGQGMGVTAPRFVGGEAQAQRPPMAQPQMMGTPQVQPQAGRMPQQMGINPQLIEARMRQISGAAHSPGETQGMMNQSPMGGASPDLRQKLYQAYLQAQGGGY